MQRCVLFLAFLVDFFVLAEGQDQHWVIQQSYHYFFSETKKSQSKSEEQCKNNGSHLLSIVDETESQFIRDQISTGFWFGLVTEHPCDDCKNAENQDCLDCRNGWYWLDGADYEYQNWETDKPSNTHTCARLFKTGQWRNGGCGSDYNFICKRKDYCEPSPCENGTCTNIYTKDKYNCTCEIGYSGKNCSTEIDECTSNPCMNNGTCINGIGFYECMCTDAWNGTNCEIDIDECRSYPCVNNGTCINGAGHYKCNCTDGWNGTNCELDIDECGSNPCINNSTCKNGVDHYECNCTNPWNGTNCELDVDECDASRVEDYCINGNCTNFEGGYNCTCFEGYRGDKCQHLNTEEDSDLTSLWISLYVTATLASISFIVMVILLFNDRYEVKKLKEKKLHTERADKKSCHGTLPDEATSDF